MGAHPGASASPETPETLPLLRFKQLLLTQADKFSPAEVRTNPVDSGTVWEAIPMETVEVGNKELGGERGGRPGLRAVRVNERMSMKSLGELGSAEKGLQALLPFSTSQ